MHHLLLFYERRSLSWCNASVQEMFAKSFPQIFMLTSLQKIFKYGTLGNWSFTCLSSSREKALCCFDLFSFQTLTHHSVVKYDAILLDTEDLKKADSSMKIFYASGHLWTFTVPVFKRYDKKSFTVGISPFLSYPRKENLPHLLLWGSQSKCQ